MACETHDELMGFNISEKTELESFIEEFGEDIPEDWEIVDEENVNDEHEDFDFEGTLNDLVNNKTELASTGTARPNQRSVQDGVNDSYNDYYKVRYVYTKDTALSQKGETREFCKLMMIAKKVYRKEDLLQLTNKPVNRGWGPRGAATYSIWLYKGGPQCFHFWTRRIFKTVIGESRTTKIEDADLIGYTKAKSEGFTAKKNSPLVAKPPKRMKNNGFLKPR